MNDHQAVLAYFDLLHKQLTNVVDYIHNAPQAEFNRDNLLALAENSLRIIDNYREDLVKDK